MTVKRLKCVNYRNIEFAELFPDTEMNVICGKNAQGKTNLVEAIWLFTGAKSFRNTKDSSPIKFGCERADCELDFTALQIENNSKLEFKEKKTAFLNEKKLSNPSLLAGNFNAIIFSPSDLELVKGGPAVRRRFLDIAIGQLYPTYITNLQAYMRAVKQRNEIIKEYRYDKTLGIMLDVFENEISLRGKKIIEHRIKYIENLKAFVSNIYKGISSGKEKLEILYISGCDKYNISEQLFNSRQEDMYSSVTSVGPHRDDISFTLNGITSRTYGSQGQQRSIALALKLSQAQVIKSVNGEYPVCLLDDVMSELDPFRQEYILNHIKGWQSFITCCDPSNIANLKNGKIFNVDNGEVRV